MNFVGENGFFRDWREAIGFTFFVCVVFVLMVFLAASTRAGVVVLYFDSAPTPSPSLGVVVSSEPELLDVDVAIEAGDLAKFYLINAEASVARQWTDRVPKAFPPLFVAGQEGTSMIFSDIETDECDWFLWMVPRDGNQELVWLEGSGKHSFGVPGDYYLLVDSDDWMDCQAGFEFSDRKLKVFVDFIHPFNVGEYIESQLTKCAENPEHACLRLPSGEMIDWTQCFEVEQIPASICTQGSQQIDRFKVQKLERDLNSAQSDLNESHGKEADPVLLEIKQGIEEGKETDRQQNYLLAGLVGLVPGLIWAGVLVAIVIVCAFVGVKIYGMQRSKPSLPANKYGNPRMPKAEKTEFGRARTFLSRVFK